MQCRTEYKIIESTPRLVWQVLPGLYRVPLRNGLAPALLLCPVLGQSLVAEVSPRIEQFLMKTLIKSDFVQ